MADPHPDQSRLRAIGKTETGRYFFLVFMLREFDGQTRLRLIGARYLHRKEIEPDERQIQAHARAAQ